MHGFAALLVLQAAGEALGHALRLPLPGPVIGLALLLPAPQWQPLRQPVAAAAELLLGHLSLLFVPVGVGVITHLDLIASHGARLLLVIVVSTWLGLAATALVLQAMLKWRARAGPQADA